MNDVMQYIGGLISKAEKVLDLDWRYSYSRLIAAGSGVLEVELSREEVMRDLVDRLEGFSIESREKDSVLLRSHSGRGVKLRLLGPATGTRLWVISSVADIRKGPDHSTELLTQAIMGESAVPLVKEGEWYLARLSDDYHGWIRSWYVSEAGVEEVRSFESRSNATMAANVGYVLSEADVESLPVSDVVAGTRIIAGGAEGGFRHVVLPGGREGYAREEDIGGPTPAIPDRVHLVERAKRFIGIPYIWGGASPKGFDCSGFVKIVFRIEGIELPRDSDLLARMGRAITLDAASVGDLLFFGEGGLVSHVAICLGEGRFIHSYGDVRINSLYADDPLYEEKLAKTLLFARCILPEGQ